MFSVAPSIRAFALNNQICYKLPNMTFHWIAGVSATLKSFGLTKLSTQTKLLETPATSELGYG